MKKIFAVVFVAGLLLSCSLEVPTEITQEYSTLPEVVDFNYHVKPILSDRCYQCHGPDEKTRKAGRAGRNAAEKQRDRQTNNNKLR